MDLASNTVLITGGGSGIGYGLAERFLGAGSTVIICGRREDKLREAQAAHPALHIRVANLAEEPARVSLAASLTREFPRLNVLLNNAGIQRYVRVAEDDWAGLRQELAINFEAAVRLSTLFLPHLRTQPRPAIINVTSGLSFVPLARAPVYCATKAALHSFTLSLRHQLRDTPVQVIEIIPPAVDTDLGGPGLHTFGVKIDPFADAVMAGLQAGDLEVAYGFGQQSSRASRDERDAMFSRLNQPGP